MLWKAIKYAVIGFVLYRIALSVKSLGLHETVYKHHPGPCRIIESLAQGSEDMERIPGDKVLITTELRFAERFEAHSEGKSGKVYMFDFNYPDHDPERVTISDYPGDMSEVDFHGMSVWVDESTGVVSVFIVNHAASYSTVEIFTYNDAENTLYHQKTCADDKFRLLNDVVAMSDKEFYVTNFAHWRHNFSKLEMILQLKWGSVLFYDGKQAIVLQDGLLMPNGINRSPDGRYIYVAHISTQEVLVYERNADNSLTEKQAWPTYTHHDNIVVDPESGDLWLGCHVVGWKVSLYLRDPKGIVSPSQVLNLRTENGLIVDMTEPFADDGKLISGSSVAVYNKNKLLIGSIASQTIICDINYVH